jgi:hypothetical protein
VVMDPFGPLIVMARMISWWTPTRGDVTQTTLHCLFTNVYVQSVFVSLVIALFSHSSECKRKRRGGDVWTWVKKREYKRDEKGSCIEWQRPRKATLCTMEKWLVPFDSTITW